MSYREAPLRIVPRVVCEDGGGYSRPAKCALCSDTLTSSTVVWFHLSTDPKDLKRAVHAICARDLAAFLKAWDREGPQVTPAL